MREGLVEEKGMGHSKEGVGNRKRCEAFNMERKKHGAFKGRGVEKNRDWAFKGGG
jgi:hypothetical protein